MKPLRIATVVHGYFPRVGGIETQLRTLVPYIEAQGIEMTILTRRYDTKLPAFQKIDGISVYRLPAPGPKAVASLVFTVAAFWRLLRLRPQLIHAREFISPATVALLAERWLKIPIVVSSHRSGEIGDVQKMSRKLGGTMRLRALRKQVSKFIVISDEIWDELRGIGVPEKQLIRIPNGVDANRFIPPRPEEKLALRKEAEFQVDAQLAIFAGRLATEKRVDLLISVWATLREEYPKAELLIVGEGAERSRLQAMAGEGIHFMGSTTDVLPFLQMVDVFVLPSITEGFSVALLEAMSCELVPLITDVGGAREVIIHKENGWLIPPDDEAALLNGLQNLFKDKEMLHKQGQAARQRVVSEFTIQIVAKKLSKLYFESAREQRS